MTFRDPESARMACLDPNPVIDGRRANCNIASLGRPRPSPPRGSSIPYTIYSLGLISIKILQLFNILNFAHES